jgi:hypothetical protein
MALHDYRIQTLFINKMRDNIRIVYECYTAYAVKGGILTVRLGWIFLQCLASLGQQEASLTLHCGTNPVPKCRLLKTH